jgi:hypothetical protein
MGLAQPRKDVTGDMRQQMSGGLHARSMYPGCMQFFLALRHTSHHPWSIGPVIQRHGNQLVVLCFNMWRVTLENGWTEWWPIWSGELFSLLYE